MDVDSIFIVECRECEPVEVISVAEVASVKRTAVYVLVIKKVDLKQDLPTSLIQLALQKVLDVLKLGLYWFRHITSYIFSLPLL